MPQTGLHLDLVLVFFIYGLAFVSMGIALFLESMRTPLLAERRALRPLAVFGLLHGIHEWLEITLLQGVWLDLPVPIEWQALRTALLAASFIPLMIFGLQGAFAGGRLSRLHYYAAAGAAALYAALSLGQAQIDPQHLLSRADVLARYTLAVPGGLLAWYALYRRSLALRAEGRARLARSFWWGALGFGVYALTQLFVAPVAMFPADLLNAQTFTNIFGFPVQILRAALALFITLNLIFAIRTADQEREQQLLAAQQARLRAMEENQRNLEEREAMRCELLRHIVVAQEDERARIARELHDETAQLLTAFTLNLAVLQNAAGTDAHLSEPVRRLTELSRQMSQGVYRLVHDLRPAQLDDLGLAAALRWLAEEGSAHAGMKVDLEILGPVRRLDPLVETVLFRVAQEALANAARHAGVSIAQVSLEFSPDAEVVLFVEDHGVGFDIHQEQRPPHGWGLAGMRERAESIGAGFAIQTAPGEGTRICMRVPLTAGTDFHPRELEHENDPLNAG